MKRYKVTITTGKLKGKSRFVWATDKKTAITTALLGCPSNQMPMATAEQVESNFKVGDKYPVSA